MEPETAAEWSLIRRGGCNGLFLVIISLAWWVWAARDAGEGVAEALEAVSDVSWVCRTMLNGASSTTANAPTAKRAADSEGSASSNAGGSSKRQRLE